MFVKINSKIMKKVSLLFTAAIVLLVVSSCNNNPKKNAQKTSDKTECVECPGHQNTECAQTQDDCCKNSSEKKGCCKDAKACDKKGKDCCKNSSEKKECCKDTKACDKK